MGHRVGLPLYLHSSGFVAFNVDGFALSLIRIGWERYGQSSRDPIRLDIYHVVFPVILNAHTGATRFVWNGRSRAVW